MRSSAYGIQPMPSPQPEPRHSVDLLDGRVEVAVRQTGEPDVALGIVLAELDEPVVVDPEHLARRLVVPEPRRGPEDTEEHLGLDAVPVHVLDAQVRIAWAADPLLAVVVEPGRRHHVHPMVLPGHVLRARRPDAADEPERRSLLGRPLQSVGPFHDVGHAVLHERRGVRGEEIGREPGHVDVTVGRDPRVAHIPSRLR